PPAHMSTLPLHDALPILDTQTIRCEVQDYIALVTMDRPPVNAVNAQFLDEMMLVFDTLSDRDDVRVAILTGAGRTFCAGADIKEDRKSTRLNSSHEWRSY